MLNIVSAESDETYCNGESCFPEQVNPFGLTLYKASKARYRYYGFLVFDGVVYTESPTILNEDFLGKKACALRLCYHRTLTADDFRRSATETLALNPAGPFDTLKARIDVLHAKYQEVNEGDCYQLSFKPGTGTELALNDKPIVTIPGDDFARAYLGIWLSPYSFSESLTQKLTTPITN
jgi:Chalcone isomerase-like